MSISNGFKYARPKCWVALMHANLGLELSGLAIMFLLAKKCVITLT